MANSKTSVFLNLALILALLLALSLAEGRTFAVGFAKSGPQCDSVLGVQEGNTCSQITQAFDLTTEFFNSINPNLNCDALFVGQWVCVGGTA
ncbi:Peptidoglycan-binding lysin domain [Melia azedarach]|uniref:Peptidoglycan-binding lysin domain n=1 Tax=Melia azedarach TaxID=155640 RepID=A0ACC1Y066_MELAZ|nr:Peptidoglycan-binding lysin domain [Melia azedarach]